jgi:hypothetical protein
VGYDQKTHKASSWDDDLMTNSAFEVAYQINFKARSDVCQICAEATGAANRWFKSCKGKHVVV